MTRFIIRALIAALGLWLASEIVPGIEVRSWGSLLAAAVLLGIVNAVVRPVVFLLTLPLTLVTLGLFLLVVNAAMLGLVGLLLKGFVVDGLWAGILGSVVVGVVSWLGHLFLGDGRERT
ncbi:putative membrane protein [Caulobacter sp. AP07]|uniref:phage holin family protein n=1 Tax=Caulobacter sp. AP07 TaxID=1144304 RepID=UPI0002721AE4|nr:phage holin family protein [Caulobacter sp. AP07]EJL34860.1 putative membrane protein [Caulobacter sp. AP07]